MAQRIMLIDDLDGKSEASQTLRFAVESEETPGKLVEVEIDLNDENFDKYNEILTLLAANGRVVEREPVKAKRPLSTGKKTGVTGKTQHIREWARANGFPNLSDRGRIPQPIMDAYETRSRMPETAVEAPKDEAKGEETTEVNPDEQKAIERVKSVPARTTRAKKAPAKDKGKTVEIPALRQVLTLVDGE